MGSSKFSIGSFSSRSMVGLCSDFFVRWSQVVITLRFCVDEFVVVAIRIIVVGRRVILDCFFFAQRGFSGEISTRGMESLSMMGSLRIRTFVAEKQRMGSVPGYSLMLVGSFVQVVDRRGVITLRLERIGTENFCRPAEPASNVFAT